jgi:hypothetical protein
MECEEYLRTSQLFQRLRSGHTVSLSSDTRHVSWEMATALVIGLERCKRNSGPEAPARTKRAIYAGAL